MTTIGPPTSGLLRCKIALFLCAVANIIFMYFLLDSDISDSLLSYASASRDSSPSIALSLTMADCLIPDLDPYDKSVAQWFRYKPYAPCPKWESPFQVLSPNRFRMKPHHISTYQKQCHYNSLEGQKFKKESEIEKEGLTVTFDTNQEVTVNASVVRIMCTTNWVRGKEYFFLHLPYRPPVLAAIKESLRKQFRVPGNKTVSSSSSSSSSSFFSSPPHTG